MLNDSFSDLCWFRISRHVFKDVEPENIWSRFRNLKLHFAMQKLLGEACDYVYQLKHDHGIDDDDDDDDDAGFGSSAPKSAPQIASRPAPTGHDALTNLRRNYGVAHHIFGRLSLSSNRIADLNPTASRNSLVE